MTRGRRYSRMLEFDPVGWDTAVRPESLKISKTGDARLKELKELKE